MDSKIAILALVLSLIAGLVEAVEMVWLPMNIGNMSVEHYTLISSLLSWTFIIVEVPVTFFAFYIIIAERDMPEKFPSLLATIFVFALIGNALAEITAAIVIGHVSTAFETISFDYFPLVYQALYFSFVAFSALCISYFRKARRKIQEKQREAPSTTATEQRNKEESLC